MIRFLTATPLLALSSAALAHPGHEHVVSPFQHHAAEIAVGVIVATAVGLGLAAWRRKTAASTAPSA